MPNLGSYMAAARRIESGSYNGQYNAIGRPVRGDRARGAYQIMGRNWSSWAAAAGLPGANWRSQMAQDRVAAYWMTEYYNRYQNWDLVAVAWFGGGRYANRLAAQGYDGPQSIPSKEIREYVTEIRGFLNETEGQGWTAPRGFNKDLGRRQGWIFPVAGPTRWSKGDYGVKHRLGNYLHNAIDIFAERGTPIVSPTAGKVVGAGSGAKKGGNWVKVLGDDGLTYYFAHMNKTPIVKKGMRINSGAHLGFVGTTGSAKGTEPHLHFTIKRDGQSINPSSFLSGSTEGGGAFNADSIPRQKAKQMGPMLGSFVDKMSNRIAGGERIDPRTLGLDQEQPEVEQLQEPEAMTEIDAITTPTRSVAEEVGT